jgi:hypothetical protein
VKQIDLNLELKNFVLAREISKQPPIPIQTFIEPPATERDVIVIKKKNIVFKKLSKSS